MRGGSPQAASRGTVIANCELEISAHVEVAEETRRDLARIEQAILGGDVRTLDEYGGLNAALKRAIVLENRARRRAGRGLTESVNDLVGVLMCWAVPEVCKRQWGSMHILALR